MLVWKCLLPHKKHSGNSIHKLCKTANLAFYWQCDKCTKSDCPNTICNFLITKLSTIITCACIQSIKKNPMTPRTVMMCHDIIKGPCYHTDRPVASDYSITENAHTGEVSWRHREMRCVGLWPHKDLRCVGLWHEGPMFCCTRIQFNAGCVTATIVRKVMSTNRFMINEKERSYS